MSDLPVGVTPTGDLVMMKRCDECHLADDLHQHGCGLSGVPPEISIICERHGPEEYECICPSLMEARQVGWGEGFDAGHGPTGGGSGSRGRT